MNCIKIGYGEIADWHEKKLRELGVKTLGVLENNSIRCQLAKSHGYHVLSDYEEALKLAPFFWDICTPTSSHVEIIQRIVKLSPKANILVEKPVCLFSQLDWLQEVLVGFRGKLSINENYQLSNVTKVVSKLIHQNNIVPTRIISEMTKNRSYDIVNGRFLDEENFVFGYEGSHLLTNVLKLGKEYALESISDVTYHDMLLEVGTHSMCLDKQGCGRACFTTKNGTEVVLYTSVNGKIGYIFPHSPYLQNHIPVHDRLTRYRVLAVEDSVQELMVVGYYEPILNYPRNVGMVMLLEKGKLKKLICPIRDDTLQLSLKTALKYFNGQAVSVYSLSEAIDAVNTLDMICRHKKQQLEKSKLSVK